MKSNIMQQVKALLDRGVDSPHYKFVEEDQLLVLHNKCAFELVLQKALKINYKHLQKILKQQGIKIKVLKKLPLEQQNLTFQSLAQNIHSLFQNQRRLSSLCNKCIQQSNKLLQRCKFIFESYNRVCRHQEKIMESVLVNSILGGMAKRKIIKNQQNLLQFFKLEPQQKQMHIPIKSSIDDQICFTPISEVDFFQVQETVNGVGELLQMRQSNNLMNSLKESTNCLWLMRESL